MKVKNIIFMMGLLIGLIGLTTNSLYGQVSACEGGSVSQTASNATATAGYSLQYMLVASDGTTVLATNSTGTFDLSGLAAGSYTMYAVNSSGTVDLTVAPPTGACIEFISQTLTIDALPTMTVSSTLSTASATADLTSAVTASSGGTITYYESDGTTVVANSAAVTDGTYIVSSTNGACTITESVVVTTNVASGISACETETVSATVSNANVIAPNVLEYMLVCGGTVTSTNTTGSFDLDALGVDAGTCDLYAVNHDGTGNLTVAPPTGACLEYITQTLTVLDAPELDASTSLSNACPVVTADLTSALVSDGGGTVTYFESDGTTVVPDETSVAAGSYIISSAIGTCIVTETVVVSIISCTGPSVCEHEVLMVSASNADVATAGYELEYMLVCGGAVTSVNSTGSFDMDALGVTDGTACTVYAVNHDGTANMAVAPPTGACVEYIEQPVIVLDITNGLCNTPVPVELLSFTGQAEGKSNMLFWSTASEINSDYFDVERSRDGENFEYLGTLEAQGESIEVTNYRLEDDAPELLSYYRLKMVDLDESFEYSNTVLIKRDISQSISISTIRPVPTKNHAIIEFTSGENSPVNFKVMDVTGKLLDESVIDAKTGVNEYTYDFSQYASAVYIITLSNENSLDVKRVIKN